MEASAQDDASGRLRLRVLTLNVWGLKYVSKKRKERIRAIADYICTSSEAHETRTRASSAGPSLTHAALTGTWASDRTAATSRVGGAGSSGSNDSNDSTGIGEGTPLHTTHTRSRVVSTADSANGYSFNKSNHHNGSRWDVVCLQEVWVAEDWEYLQERAKQSGSGLVYGRYFWSGALGSGLCILSKFPIVSTSTWPYSLNGSPLHVIEGDFYVGKACGQATLDLGRDYGHVTVLNTHFFAPGGEYGDEWKRSHRLTQAWELAKLATVAAERGQHVIVCGDLNSIPTSLPTNLLLAQGKLNDAWSCTNSINRHPISGVPPTALEAIQHNGITCDNPLNTWSAGKTFSEEVTRHKGKRLDYIMFRRAKKGRGAADTSCIHVEECRVTATENCPGTDYSLTDHFGVEAQFAFTSFTDDGPMSPVLQDHAEEALIPARPHAREALSLALAAITIYASHSHTAHKSQLTLFGLSLLGIPVLSVAASFQPIKWLNWIFVLLGIGTGVMGATMLYTGFVGGRWERSAIKNVMGDMAIELERIDRDAAK